MATALVASSTACAIRHARSGGTGYDCARPLAFCARISLTVAQPVMRATSSATRLNLQNRWIIHRPPWPRVYQRRWGEGARRALTTLSSRHGPADQETRCQRHITRLQSLEHALAGAKQLRLAKPREVRTCQT